MAKALRKGYGLACSFDDGRKEQESAAVPVHTLYHRERVENQVELAKLRFSGEGTAIKDFVKSKFIRKTSLFNTIFDTSPRICTAYAYNCVPLLPVEGELASR